LSDGRPIRAPYFAPGEYDTRCRAALKSFTPAPFGAIIADMSPRIIHIPLSGGNRKPQAKGIRCRSGVHGHRIRIPKGLQPRVSQFVRAGMQAALKVFL